MRLLNTSSLELGPVHDTSKAPDYVILSHRWSVEEVTFADIQRSPISNPQSPVRTKTGFAKVQGSCQLALRDGYEWIWIDSCCIDTSSSAELQETINSMWRYYEQSNICYVYMLDVIDVEAGWNQKFAESEWFTRGWTLQELIAPACVEFYTKNWEPIGTKFQRHKQIATITSIDSDVLVHNESIDMFSTAERLSWAAHRNVARKEDEAYCLLGLFDVNMPLLYGEGREKAFVRLQEAIYSRITDDSIFLFRHSLHHNGQPLLADSPTRFCDRVDCTSCLAYGIRCLPSNIRYAQVVASERWTKQAHGQIVTTITATRNEMSTTLPLLEYQEISDMLKHFDATPKAEITHVAILNHTLKKYPQGALCLLLARQPKLDFDACLRISAFPVLLPHLGALVYKLEPTKLLFCPSRMLNAVSNTRVKTLFSVKSDAFHVESWRTKSKSGKSILFAEVGENLEYDIRMITPGKSNSSIQVSCQITGSQDPALLLSIQLIWRSEIWLIKEVSHRKQVIGRERKLQTLFLSSTPTDRCSIRLPDGKVLLIAIRRLPGAARALGQEDSALVVRYQISVGIST